jgi:non-specific serine/threonine protein kinase
MKTDRGVIKDLPDKTEVKAWCNLSKSQAALYQQAVSALDEQIRRVEGIARRGAVLAFLMRFKQISNHPSQWLGDGVFDPQASGRFVRIAEICESIGTRQEKALVFTQFKEMTEPLAAHLALCSVAPASCCTAPPRWRSASAWSIASRKTTPCRSSCSRSRPAAPGST